MNTRYYIIVLCAFCCLGCANRNIDKALNTFNNNSVPYISVKELSGMRSAVVLDTREKLEYEVSHIPGASWVGHRSFALERLESLVPNKDTSIVVYCSIGVRSEDIGEVLMENGYTDVQNLYGGIFQWKNLGFEVVDPEGNVTENVHAYSKYWGKLLTEANKVY